MMFNVEKCKYTINNRYHICINIMMLVSMIEFWILVGTNIMWNKSCVEQIVVIHLHRTSKTQNKMTKIRL